jgi:hypothetical protein
LRQLSVQSPSQAPLRCESPIEFGFLEISVTSVTVQLNKREIEALKERTGRRNAEAALKAWRPGPIPSTPLLR